MSTVQAVFSCTAGFLVCTSSCKRSFLTASHYASDAYGWFGCAYFIYDMWSMYEVHVQKIIDKQTLFSDDVLSENVTIRNGSNELYDKLNTTGNDDYHTNGGGIDATKQAKEMERSFFAKRLEKVPNEAPSFIWYCLTNPVMTIHHVFLISFGLLVIVVCKTFMVNFKIS